MIMQDVCLLQYIHRLRHALHRGIEQEGVVDTLARRLYRSLVENVLPGTVATL